MSIPQRAPIVSVVTPAYNEENYIGECIESVRAQTFQDWEYIIVNNCSTDRTLEIAQRFAATDPRIRIRSNEKFVSIQENHNIALRAISPGIKYCKVVEADDFIFPCCLEKMLRCAEANPSAAIIGAHKFAGTQLSPHGLPFPKTFEIGRDVCRSYLMGKSYPFGIPTSVLYRADVVRDRPDFFDPAHLNGDVRACLDILQSHDLGYVHEVLAFERIRDNSVHSYVKKNNLYIQQYLECLKIYGKYYLTEAELQKSILAALAEYYEFLGSCLYQRSGQEFWRLHESRLAELGYPLSRVRLLLYGLCYGAEAVLRRGRRRLYGAPVW